MSLIEVKLNQQNSRKLDELSRQTGRSAEELANEAVSQFSIDAQEHERFLAWREALLRIEGMWADHDDLPDFGEIRRSLDRNLWET